MNGELIDKRTTEEKLQRLFDSELTSSKDCSHFELLGTIHPQSEGCDLCLQSGDTWVNLRMCLICGDVGCCNDSKNKHASKHYDATKHALMMTIEAHEDWVWCYIDEALYKPVSQEG